MRVGRHRGSACNLAFSFVRFLSPVQMCGVDDMEFFSCCRGKGSFAVRSRVKVERGNGALGLGSLRSWESFSACKRRSSAMNLHGSGKGESGNGPFGLGSWRRRVSSLGGDWRRYAVQTNLFGEGSSFDCGMGLWRKRGFSAVRVRRALAKQPTAQIEALGGDLGQWEGGGRIVVVGDVHGCKEELELLLREVRFQPDRDRWVQLSL